jgi:hypothetical protein
MQIYEHMESRQREQQLRDTLAQSGGDVEKAMQAAIQSGNLAGAKSLAAVIEAQRKTNAPRVMSPGSQLLGPNNEVLHTTPFAPRPEAQPEILKLQNFLTEHGDKIPPQGRAQIEARIAHLSRGESEQRPFGSGATGGALEMITKLAPAYGAGTLTPDQERFFDAAVTHYTQPRQYQDPDTGLMTTRRPELPPFVQEAINRKRGTAPQPRPAPEASPQPTPGPQPSPRPQGERTTKTVWELASLITGPVPAAAEGISRTPLVGDLVQAPQFTQSRNQVKQQQNDLVRVLMNNPRYAEGERKAIRDEINIDPRLWDNPTAYRDRLIGIDNALEIRERNAFNTANSARVGREERIQAMNILNALRAFRDNLGVPPRVANDADWEALQPGTEYIAPDGRVKKKR